MKNNDVTFMKRVLDLYYATLDRNHPEGNISEVSEQLAISRAKVHKILITMDAIDSPLHKEVAALRAKGYDADSIAQSLGVSRATVVINLPYEKVIYGNELNSPEAIRVGAFRNRERIFLQSEVRRPEGVKTMDHKIEEPSAEFALKDNAIRLHIELKDDFAKDQTQTLKQYGGALLHSRPPGQQRVDTSTHIFSGTARRDTATRYGRLTLPISSLLTGWSTSRPSSI